MADRKSPSSEINFKAVHEGLGFHPFSDGLPYAPVSKRARERPFPGNGAGAQVAGPVSVSPAITRPMPRVNVPVATAAVAPSAASIPTSLGIPTSYRPHAGTPTPREAAKSAEPSTFQAPSLGMVYLSKRLMAYVLDTALNLSAVVAALSFVLVRNDVNPEALVSSGVVLLTAVFLAFFNWAVITAQEIAFGTSIGKRVFGLALQGSASAIFLRAFFFLPSVGFAGLGLLWALFNRERRCWHDVAVDLQPMEVAQL